MHKNRIYGSFKNIENIIISGGYFKGVSFIETILQIEKYNPGFMKNLKRFCGTSIGSIICLLLIMSKNKRNFIQHANVFFYNNVLWDVKFIKKQIRYHHILFNKKCLIEDHYILKLYLLDLFEYLKIDKNTSLIQFFNQTGKEFIINSYCLKRNKIIYFNHVDTPNLRLIDCLLCSMNLPIIFEPYDKIKGYWFVDGGVTENVIQSPYPSNKTIEIRQQYTKVNPLQSKKIWNVFGNLLLIFIKELEKYNKIKNIKLKNSITVMNQSISYYDFYKEKYDLKTFIKRLRKEGKESFFLHFILNEPLYNYLLGVILFCSMYILEN